MLSPIYCGTILRSVQYTAARVCSARPRPVVFVLAAVLLLALIVFPEGQAAFAQTYSAQTYSAQTYSAQTYSARTYRAWQRAVLALQQQQLLQEQRNLGMLPVSGGYPGATSVEGQAAPAQPSRASRAHASHRSVLAQQQALQKKQQQTLQQKHNEGTLLILGGYPGTSYFNLAHEMAAALSESADLRLIAVDACGGIESLRDLLLLRGVDLALVPENVLYHADATASLQPGPRERLTYITQLYGEEVHILVGPSVSSIEDLRGKKVAVPPQDGNAEFTVRDLLRRLHIGAEVIEVAAADAIDEVRSGTLAALVLVGGKPLRFVTGIPKDGTLRVLALPSSQALGDGYSPGSFQANDYPTLIPEEQTVNTVSVSAVLVANNTDKSKESYQRIARFVPAFFDALSELAGPRWHPKWGEVNLAATLTRWPRFPAAQQWLDRTLREQTASVQRDFEDFLQVNSAAGSPTPSPEARRQLFEEYLRWTRSATGARQPGVSR
jgi:TRAP-type uncharacterized transport system substrate-binding protein